MIIHFLPYFVLSSYASIDLGSQFIRIALTSLINDVKIIINDDQKIQTPSAVAFKNENIDVLKRHLTNDEGYKSILKYGEEAVKFLKKHPYAGTDRITYYLGRYNILNKDDIHFPLIANATELLSILLTKLFMNQQFAGLEGISVTVPRYYTLSQREAITQSMYLARLPFYGIYDDDSAIIQLYYIKCLQKINTELEKNVLFIDLGASGVRSYRVEFYKIRDKNKFVIFANQTSYFWSEDTGGFLFAKQISKNMKISESKSQKLLISLSNSKKDNKEIQKIIKILDKQLIEIKRVITKAINGNIDEVQIIGSCSRYNFIQELIELWIKEIYAKKNINKDLNILKELPASEAIALGSLHYFNGLINLSKYNLVDIRKAPLYSTTVECGGLFEDYCNQNYGNCSQYIVFDSSICQKITISIDSENDLPLSKVSPPKGCGNILAQFTLKNITNFQYELSDNLKGFLLMDAPQSSILSAFWCKSPNEDNILNRLNNQEQEDTCDVIDFEPTPLTDLENSKKYDFIHKVLDGDDDRKLIIKYKQKLDLYIRTLQAHLDSVTLNSNDESDNLNSLLEEALFIKEDNNIIDIQRIIRKFEEYFKKLKMNL